MGVEKGGSLGRFVFGGILSRLLSVLQGTPSHFPDFWLLHKSSLQMKQHTHLRDLKGA